MVAECAPFVRATDGVAGRAIVMLDMDDMNIGVASKWFEDELREHLVTGDSIVVQPLIGAEQRARIFEISSAQRTGRAALVLVGLAASAETVDRKIDRFAIDDYIQRLVVDRETYEANTDLKRVSHSTAMEKLGKFADALRANNIAPRSSKHYLQLLCAICRFRPSSAEFINRVMKHARGSLGTEKVRAFFQPLIQDLEAAASVLGV